jgi:Na+/proline symporter
MGVMLLLRTPWWLVLEACEGFGDILEHGYVDGLSHVVPVDVHAEVPLHVIIVGALIVLAENEEGEVFGMLTANILDAKIIRTQ